MVAVAMAGLLSAAVAAVFPRSSLRVVRGSDRTTEALVVVVLAGVPVLQAVGTNVPLLYVSAECLALWVAVVVLLATRGSASPISSLAVATNLAVCVVAVALLSGTTTLVSPFKTTGLTSDTVAVAEPRWAATLARRRPVSTPRSRARSRRTSSEARRRCSRSTSWPV